MSFPRLLVSGPLLYSALQTLPIQRSFKVTLYQRGRSTHCKHCVDAQGYHTLNAMCAGDEGRVGRVRQISRLRTGSAGSMQASSVLPSSDGASDAPPGACSGSAYA